MNWQAEATVPEPVFEEWVEETKQAGEPLTTTALVRKASRCLTSPSTPLGFETKIDGRDSGAAP